MLVEIGHSKLLYPMELCTGHGFLRAHRCAHAPRLHFDEDDLVTVLRDQINLTPTRSLVLRDDTVSQPTKMLRSKLLTVGPEISSPHDDTNGITGR